MGDTQVVQVDLGDGQICHVAVDLDKVPALQSQPPNHRHQVITSWIKQEIAAGNLQIANSSEPSLMPPPTSMEVTTGSLKRGRSLTPNSITPTSTPVNRSVSSSPSQPAKKPCVQTPCSPIVSLLPSNSVDTPVKSPVQIVPVSQHSKISPSKMDEVNNLISSLRTLEEGFGDKIGVMNKLIHDTKEGLQPMVTSLSSKVTKELEPQVNTLKASMDTIKPAISTLRKDIHNEDTGVVPRLNKLEVKVDSTKKKIDALTREIPMPTTGPTTWTSTAILERFEELEADVLKLNQQVQKQEVSLSIVASWSDVMFHQIHSLQEQLYHNTARHMQNELIIGGIKQTKKENCREAAINFFQDKLGITAKQNEVWYGYRKGSTTTKTINGQKVKCPPQMVVRVAFHLRELVMQNAKKLKDVVDPVGKYKFFVFPHLPEAFRAARTKFKKIIADLAKKPGPTPRTRITGTKMFVNGNIYSEIIEPPPPSKVVNRMQMYGEKIQNIPLIKTRVENRKGNKFYGYAVRAKTLQTVDMAYVKIRAAHPFTRHIMCVYHAAEVKGSCEDGEWFGDQTIQAVFDANGYENVAMFIVRIPGDQQIGAQRFEVIRMLSQELAEMLNNQTDKEPWDAEINPFEETLLKDNNESEELDEHSSQMDSQTTGAVEDW